MTSSNDILPILSYPGEEAIRLAALTRTPAQSAEVDRVHRERMTFPCSPSRLLAYADQFEALGHPLLAWITRGEADCAMRAQTWGDRGLYRRA